MEVEDGVKVLARPCLYNSAKQGHGYSKWKTPTNGTHSNPHGLRLPINYFFTSLAQDQKEKSIGIILSGFGSDGSIGLKTIKANGGMMYCTGSINRSIRRHAHKCNKHWNG